MLRRAGRFLCALLATMGVLGCAGTDFDRLVQATPRGYSREIDDPSGRGNLKRVSPEHIDVRGKYCVSPNGRFIVFAGVSGVYGTGSGAFGGGGAPVLDLWKIPVDGGAPTKLTAGASRDNSSPSYASDGSHIVYESGGKIWKVRADGAGGKQKIPGSGTGYDVSPDVSISDRVVFCSVEGSGDAAEYFIWTCRMDGGELTQIREGSHPAWSPDGLRIAFEYEGDIWLIDGNGTNMMQLTSTANTTEGLPSFSPDGRRIVYASNEGLDGKPMDHDFNIWHMSVEGSEKVQITELSSWDSWPRWSGSSILFLSARGSEASAEARQRLWRVELR